MLFRSDSTYVFGDYPFVSLQKNEFGSGSQYPNMNIVVDSTTNIGSGVYASYTIADNTPNAAGPLNSVALAINSYTPEYSNNYTNPEGVAIIQGGGAYNGAFGDSDTVFGFRSGSLDIWKPSRFKASVIVTGSVNVTGGITGSLRGTASFATTASYAINAGTSGYANNFDRTGLIQTASYTAQQTIKGKVEITGSIFNKGKIGRAHV